MVRTVCFVFAFVYAMMHPLAAATYTWDAGGGASNTWSTASNWNPDTVPTFVAGDVFNLSSLDITASSTSTVNFNATLGSISIGDSTGASHAWTLASSGGSILTLDNAGVAAQITQVATSLGDTISVPLLTAGNLNITNTSTTAARILIFGGTIASSASTGTQTILVNSTTGGGTRFNAAIGDGVAGGQVAISVVGGTGSVIQNVSFFAANSFSGAFTVGSLGGGINYVSLSHNSALGNSSTITINGVVQGGGSGTRLTLANGISISGKTLNIVSGASATNRASLFVDANSTASWLGNIVISGSGQNAIYANGAAAVATIGAVGGTNTITGTNVGIALRGGAGGLGTINSVISLGTGSLNKTDGGAWVVASTGNTWVNTNIQDGTLRTSVSNALPASSILIMGQNSGTSPTFDLAGTSQTINRFVSFVNTVDPGTSNRIISNSVTGTTAVLTVNNDVDASTAIIGGTFVKTIQITGNTRIVKGGPNALTINGTATFTGGLTVNSGVLNLASAYAFGTGVVTVNGGTLNITTSGTGTGGVTVAGGTFVPSVALAYTGGTTLTSGLIQPTGSGTLGSVNNTLTVSGGTLDLNGLNQTVGNFTGTGGTVTNNGGAPAVLTIGQNNASGGSFAGTISNGTSTVAITKIGTGTLTLAGPNVYTGVTTINTGTLNVSNTFPSGSDLTVAAGGKFGLTGTPQALSTPALSLGASGTGTTVLGLQLAATPAGSDSITSGAPAVAQGAIQLDLTFLPGFTANTYNLLSAPSGLTASNPTYTIGGTVPFGFGYTLTPTDTLVSIQFFNLTPSTGPIFWTGVVSSSWNTTSLGSAENFSTDAAGTTAMVGLPNSTNTVNFSAANATAGTTVLNTLDNSFTINDLVFAPQADTSITSITIAPGTIATNTLTISPSTSSLGVTLQSGAPMDVTVSAPITLGGPQTWTVTSVGTTFTSAGTLTGSTPLTLAGAGNVGINNAGTAFTGNIVAGTPQLTFGGTVATTINGVISGAALVTKAGSGALTLNGVNTYTGNTVLAGGTLNLGNANAISTGSFTLAGGTIFNNTSGAAFTLPNNPQFWDGSFTFTGTNSVNTGTGAVTLGGNFLYTVSTAANAALTVGVLTVDGIVTDGGSGFALTKAGAGTLILNGANTYTGNFTINAGVVVTPTLADFSSPSGLGAGVNLSINGSTLRYNGTTNASSNRPINITGAAVVEIVPSATLEQTVELSGAITGIGSFTKGPGGTQTVANFGSSVLILSGPNTFTGNVTINNGNLMIRASDGLGDTNASKTITITAGTAGAPSLRFDPGTGNTITLPASFSFTTSYNGVNIINPDGRGTFDARSGNTVINGTVSLTSGGGSTAASVAAGATLEFAGNIGGVTADLRGIELRGSGTGIVSGIIQNTNTSTTGTVNVSRNFVAGQTSTAVWTLTNNNTYTAGTVVSAGTLLVNGQVAPNSGTGTGAVTVSGTNFAGGTPAIFGGTGRVAGLVTVNNFTAPGTVGGTIRGGDVNAVGSLELAGGLTVNAGGQIAVRITDAGPSAFASTGGSSQGSAPFITNNNFLNITGGTTIINGGAIVTVDGTGVTFLPDTAYSYLIATGAGTQAFSNTDVRFTNINVAPGTAAFTGVGSDLFVNFVTAPVPEPVMLFGAAMMGLAVIRRRK